MNTEPIALDEAEQTNMTWEETPLLSPKELQQLNPTRVPKHVAIIPDGNRRWAKKHRFVPKKGHSIGAETLMNVVKAGHQMGIEVLTFYVFSTENWQRPKREVKAQIWLLEKSLIQQKQRMIDNGVQFKTIGELSKFPPRIVELIEEVKDATKHCHKITVVFALNYGGRDDIVRAVHKMVDDYDRKKINKDDFNEESISRYLDTAMYKDPDLLIRTSGESRISNFLLWQLSYAEIYLSKVLWPEFTPQYFLEAICDYQKRDRRLGGS
ncbi:MAG: Ditrans,polycis-undecaprenyl-diphosphate synthase ((2E,6E)-farnesyl-diphosphate specific) [Chlamydiae bacterium]|nr:Ditrans,polycis-undecaprenyl-diphosphate synthase ((2E,6E)-farnesyl-diphosphate specific) [Chlamydiota bacterium]